ncbi:hypothetical protein G3570_03140 [Balneolaceae bacterium YR4-1]|uniref:histidine kinase n=1 Tax=Halalkalibaculum roseum TaxID=2709311 RepID=A0A6M1SS88_9BACT|nr:ATP-binding protein [Halalkalibaculum roseum]NGP75612.1 hypothetical protein [Halalkalibaculum roseum]
MFESFPSGLLVLELDDTCTPPSFRQVNVNEAACRVTGMEMKSNNGKPWREMYPGLAQTVLTDIILDTISTGKTKHWEVEREGTGKSGKQVGGFVWFISKQVVGITFNDMPGEESQKKGLDKGFVRQSVQLESAIDELESFTYSVAHDLRAPLRRLDGFSQELLNEYSEQLDETGKHYLNRIRVAAQKMGSLIDDLLKLSRISKKNIETEYFDLGTLALELVEELREWDTEREVAFHNEGDLGIHADKGLFRSLMQNLLSNAWKFSSDRKPAQIKVGSTVHKNRKTYYVQDNGVGFDMKFAGKLFRAFQRLHSEKKFEGTGIGLATVQRIINRHGGRIWAESKPEKGATFYFYLTENKPQETK